MKVVAFNGSARRGGNTAILLGYTLSELKKHRNRTSGTGWCRNPWLPCLPQVFNEEEPPLLSGKRYGERLY